MGDGGLWTAAVLHTPLPVGSQAVTPPPRFRAEVVAVAAKDDVGRRGEQLAAQVLTDEGYTLLTRNWRGRDGELDMVARDGGTLVAVEVKTRSGSRFGHPAEAVTARKLARLRRLTGQWLAEHGHEMRPRCRDVRIDVVAVTLPRDGVPTVELLRGVC